MSLKVKLQQKLHENCIDAYEKLLWEQQLEIANAYPQMLQKYETREESRWMLPVPKQPVIYGNTVLIPYSWCVQTPDFASLEAPFFLLAKDCGFVSKLAFTAAEEYLTMHPEIRFLYGHEDMTFLHGAQTEKGSSGKKPDWLLTPRRRFSPWFKPAWSPDTLLSYFYPGSMVLLRREELCHVNWKGSANPLENIYDAVLKLTISSGREGMQLNQVLYHHAAKAAFADTAALLQDCGAGSFHKKKMEKEAFRRFCRERKIYRDILGTDRKLPGAEPEYLQIKKDCYRALSLGTEEYKDSYGITHLHPASDGRTVSILIPSRDHPSVLERCIKSIRERTKYPSYEIIVVDNGSALQAKQEYERLSRELDFQYYYEKQEFNFSKMCNAAAGKARGSYYLFLNDDMEVITSNWLTLLSGQLQLPWTGAAGAKLYYPGGTLLQHTGITNLTEGPVHKLQGYDDGTSYYYGANRMNRNVIGVTAACLMIEADKFQQIGGFAEELAVAYNDVDLNFRLLQEGFWNVLLNDVVLYHHESLSRGNDMADEHKMQRLRQENKCLFERNPYFYRNDPYYGSWMTGMSAAYEPGYLFENKNLSPVPGLRKSTEKPKEEQRNRTLILHVDHAGPEPVVYPLWQCMQKSKEAGKKAAEFCLLDLHIHIRGLDSADYTYKIFLKNASGVWEVPCRRRYREDVVKGFPEEKNVELSGFAARIPMEFLEEGSYEIWVKASSGISRQVLWNRADTRLER